MNVKRSLWKKYFAMFCVTVLLLTSFQIVLNGAGAEDSEVTEPAPVPLYPPEGTVENIGGSSGLTVSSPNEIVPRSYVTIESYGICYWTQYGTYIFNKAAPEKMSLVSLNSTRAISEAFFTVEYSSEVSITADAIVTEMTDDLLKVNYSLLDPSSLKTVGKMGVTFEFFANKAPKITATVDSIDMKSNWQVVWIVVPPKDASLRTTDTKDHATSLSSLIGTKLSSSRQSVSVDVGGDGLVLDWRDAGSGDLEVTTMVAKDKADPALKVRFTNETAVIDPTIVTTSSNADPTGYSSQRKVSWYGGYFWLFYNGGSAICYRNSIDGITWSGEFALPEGTTPSTRGGFDVAMRSGYVLVGWSDTNGDLMIKKGMIVSSSIVWSSRCNLNSYLSADDGYFFGNTVSVAIGDDNSFWISQGYWNSYDGYAYICVLKCMENNWGTFYWMTNYNVISMYQSVNSVFILLPCLNGNMAMVETGYNSPPDTTYNGCIRVHRYWSGVNDWSNSGPLNIGINTGQSPSYAMDMISAVASDDGTVHVAFIGGTYAKYTSVSVSGSLGPTSTFSQYAVDPAICLDDNDDLRIFYNVIPSSPPIYHLQCVTKEKNSDTWSTFTTIYSNTFANPPKGLTSWMNPVGVVSLAWAEDSGTSRSIKFGSVPLPFGTPGAAADPWNRDGLSPYGTYFSSNGDIVSPGTGQLTVLQQDVSIPGRGGVDLGISRIYQQPKYFQVSSGAEYGNKQYPFCNLGRYWSLDLPWMDANYVYLSNGQRFVIQWGNEGNVKEFVNHDSIHFTLRDASKLGRTYYELITSSGVRYEFEHANPFKLIYISDLEGYDPTASTYSTPLNRLTLNYSGNTLTSITDSGLGRAISFTYSSGRLSRITAPDGSFSTFAYTQYSSYWYLTSTTDSGNRVTSFSYDPNADRCLSGVQYPTGGKVVYSYALDGTPATEVRSWVVTSEAVRNTATDVLIRQTSFDYKIANGKVSMVTQTDYDEGGLLQGSTRYIFQSALKFQDTATLNATGSQMQRSRTWFDSLGQPVRVDSYLGDSTTANYSTYSGYDDWGNLIYTRNALGHESYLSYANTSTQNSFQGSSLLTRTSSGRIFYEAFDGWDWSSWTRNMGDGYNALGAGLDASHSPAMKIVRTGAGGEAYLEHTFAAQSGDFAIQTSLMSNMVGEAKIQVFSGTAERVAISASGTTFQYWNNGYWVVVASCSAYNWYDVAISIHPSSNTYDIYINGNMVANALTLLNSGNIDKIRFNAGPTNGNIMWFDDVRIYKGQSVTVNGLGSGYVIELFDSRNNVLARSKTGTVNFPIMPLFAPPAYIRIAHEGDRSFSTPLMDIWGGDVYSMEVGLYSAGLTKVNYGFGANSSVMADDDGVPSGATYYYAPWDGAGNRWVTNSNYAMRGTSYHASVYAAGIGASQSHYYGWVLPPESPSYMDINNATDSIVQYVWLEDGKLPQEIVLQYNVDGIWKRAYWGGDGTNQDIIFMTSPLNNPSTRHRVGDVPQITGKWLQLTVKVSDLGIGADSKIFGIISMGSMVGWPDGTTPLRTLWGSRSLVSPPVWQ